LPIQDHGANHLVLKEVVKNWFNPVNHWVNKVWVERNQEGWKLGEEEEEERVEGSRDELRKDASRRAALRALKIATVRR
jgi:hypothetical protein